MTTEEGLREDIAGAKLVLKRIAALLAEQDYAPAVVACRDLVQRTSDIHAAAALLHEEGRVRQRTK